ncbi:MAG: GFA family protein [Acidiferrobacterales bacterium]
MANKTIEGGCLCGAVRYRVAGEPYNLTNCHCIMCRKASAAPFVSWASFKSNEIKFTKDAPTRYTSSAKAVRSFCSKCGTPLTFQLIECPDEIDLTICSMDEPGDIVPRDHVWTQRRLPWIKLADGLPQYNQERNDG